MIGSEPEIVLSHVSGVALGIAMLVGKSATLMFCADIHGPRRINPTDFGDLLTFLTTNQLSS